MVMWAAGFGPRINLGLIVQHSTVGAHLKELGLVKPFVFTCIYIRTRMQNFVYMEWAPL